jgi:hypothetical protein
LLIGRAGEDGVAYTFFTDYDKHLGGALCDLLKSFDNLILCVCFETIAAL